jgi:predicted small lipoprotein YifL
MKRLLSLLMIVSVMSLVLAGCGEKAAEGEAAKTPEAGTEKAPEAGK